MSMVFRNVEKKLHRLIFKISPRWAEALDLAFPIESADRHFLEREIFAYINKRYGGTPEKAKLLFIGLDKHNWHYHRLLNVDFHTIDIAPKNAK